MRRQAEAAWPIDVPRPPADRHAARAAALRAGEFTVTELATGP